MKKIFLLLLSLIFIFSLCACSGDKAETQTSDTTSVTEPFETVEDNGKVEIQKEYTMEELLKIKTNWNKEYVFPCEVDKVKITKKDNQNIVMTLAVTEKTYDEVVKFYDKYTATKQNRNSTKTAESYFISFDEDYTTRTIMMVKNTNNTFVTVTYSLDNANKR